MTNGTHVIPVILQRVALNLNCSTHNMIHVNGFKWSLGHYSHLFPGKKRADIPSGALVAYRPGVPKPLNRLLYDNRLFGLCCTDGYKEYNYTTCGKNVCSTGAMRDLNTLVFLSSRTRINVTNVHRMKFAQSSVLAKIWEEC